MELIAYEPQTPQVHAMPILCSPPWINKYYIMDLAPGRSFVEWAVQHGHQTFMISYRNPDESLSHLTMDDYLRDGVLVALDVVQEITGAPQVNVAALCLGGTLALVALAYLAAHGQGGRIGSVTLTNTLVDFSIPGDLGVFTDEDTIARLEKRMRERGYPRVVGDGADLRLAAFERLDLELRRQQLVQRQAAAGVRHSRVEQRLHADAGRDALAVSARVLPS